jgi:transcription elongation factor GreA
MKYITKEKLIELREQLRNLRERRKEISKQISEAQERGDISESAEYAEAKETQAFNEGRIKELEQLLNDAVVISNKKNNCSRVEVGCEIVVKNHNEKREFAIVGSQEAEPSRGKISNESPLGRAFLGKKKGDEIIVHTPRGKIAYKILEIK